MDNNIRNISNIKVNKECYKMLKKMSIDKEVTLQKVVQEILERAMSKKSKPIETNEEI